MNESKILIVEDDIDINNLLSRILKGYGTVSAFSGTEAKFCVKQEEFDLILLDLMLPGMTGEEFIVEVRKNSNIPIIVLSAKVALEDKVNVLRLGADDFISKPFEVEDVIARVEAQLRRYKTFSVKVDREDCVLNFQGISLNVENMEVKVKKEIVSLTSLEFDILKLLMTHPKKVFTRENIFLSVWKDEHYAEENTVNVHISNLRAKIAKIDRDTEYIKTVWGIGFKMADE